MAKEVSEVVRSQALRAAREKFDEATKDRIIPMRWLLTWKPLSEPAKAGRQDRAEGRPHEGQGQGYPHRVQTPGPREARCPHRCKAVADSLPESPTMSRLGRNLLLQGAALDGHTVECADATSTFLQADADIGTKRLYTKGVPEVARALGLQPGKRHGGGRGFSTA